MRGVSVISQEATASRTRRTKRKNAELADALATVTKNAKKLAGAAARGTAGWEKAMHRAREQAKGYAEAIPDEWPPFLVVVDVGYCFDLYADFTGSGKSFRALQLWPVDRTTAPNANLQLGSVDVTDAPSVGPALLRFHRRILLKK